MRNRCSLWILLFAVSFMLGPEAPAKLIPGTSNSLPKIVTSHGTYILGKKPYPAGTRDKWIAEGRALARAPDGYFPRTKTLKGAANNSAYLPPIGDQGSEGSCVHWAGTYHVKTANMKRFAPSLNITITDNQCSPRFTYNLTNLGADNGGYGHEPFEIFMRYGVASLKQKPYTAGQFTTLPVVADFVEGLQRRSTNYVWVWDWTPSPAEITELKTFLDAGGVAACAIDADDSFDAWTPGGSSWVGPTCTPDDLNHMVTVCGYGANYYLVANSWGPSFGSNGLINVDATYFEHYVGDVMYPLEPTTSPVYPAVTNYAILQISHGRRSDIRSLAFSVNGVTVWSNSPLPKNLPKGTGSFDTDTRAGWQLAVPLDNAPWGAANVVTARCMDNVSGTAGSITNFTVYYKGVAYKSSDTPASIPDNTGVPAYAKVLTQTPTNFPPVLAAIGNKSVLTNNVLSFNVTASDSTDHDMITLWATGVPPWAVFNAVTNATSVTNPFLGTAPATVGSYVTTFFASDNDGTNKETITISVTAGGCVSTTLIDEGFDAGTTPPSGWTFTSIGATYTSVGNYNRASPSLKFDASNDRVETPTLSSPTNLSFWIKSLGGTTSTWLVESYIGGSWSTVASISPLPSTGTTKNYALSDSVTKLRFTFTKAVGNLAFDDVIISGCGGAPVGNHAPVITVAGDTNQSATVNTELSFAVTASDADSETVGLRTNSAPAGANFPFTSGTAPIQGTFTWTPTATGRFTAVFVAYDATVAVTQGVNIVVTQPLLAPIIQAASGVQETRFNANWLAAAGASGYQLDVATNSTFSGGASTTNLSDNFAKFITANGTTDRSGSLDTYMQTAGWTGSKIYENSGTAKLGTSTTNGWITTPTVNLSAHGGAATVKLDLMQYGTDASALIQVMHAADGVSFEQVGSDLVPPVSMAQQTVEITEGTTLSKIQIRAKGTAKSRFYLDNILISQGAAGGLYIPGYQGRDVGAVTTHTVTGLTVNIMYYYRVKAYNAASNSVYSSVTNVLTAAALQDIKDFTVPAGATASATLSSSTAGKNYGLQYTTNLMAAPVVWKSVDTDTGTGGEITLSDPTPSGVVRIYRVVIIE